MGRPIDFILGKIEEMHVDGCAGWKAFYRSEAENDRLRKELEALRKLLGKRRAKNVRS